MGFRIYDNDIFGLIRPDNDIHTLGISSFANIIENCGYKVYIGNEKIAKAISSIAQLDNIAIFENWIINKKITIIGFSYRLDPQDAQKNFGRVYYQLRERKLLEELGGPIRQIYFAGLPESCDKIKREYNNRIPVFMGDETQLEILNKLKIPNGHIPNEIIESTKYDDIRMDFAKELIASGKHDFISPLPRLRYPNYGTSEDTIMERVRVNQIENRPPLMRVHVGPYNTNYKEAKKQFNSWLKLLSDTGFLDIVSIGSSQLSQSDFGTDWTGMSNGGGVPINSEHDLVKIWEASRPMLIRTYSGTRETQRLAEIYERTLHICWHALSLWWFNRIDGRGPHDVLTNLKNHLETFHIIAQHNKPFEPNIPHHFSFRGGDDYTYVLSSYLAALTAKRYGIKYLILQVMLNTPKYTWGIQDLAKSRALLKLVRELEDGNFKVYLQPRAGLDYFSPNLDKAKVQLAAVSAMMDDIEPNNYNSPDIIHVVSYCEAVKLATPTYINESIQITMAALNEYRRLKKDGVYDHIIDEKEVKNRTRNLYIAAKEIKKIIETNIKDPYTPYGLYEIFKKGVLTAPYLWEGREEFKNANQWKTGLYSGGIYVLDDKGKPMDPITRIKNLF
jgi:hypothetical protein